MKSEEVKKLEAEVKRLFPDKEMQTAVLASLGLIRHLEEEITGIETMILKKLKIKKEFARLITLPGIGKILALTIMLEVGNIRRFPTVGDYSSYCRCVKSIRTSAGKSSATAIGRTGTSIFPGLTSRLHNLRGGSTRRYGTTIRRRWPKRTGSSP